MIVDKYSDLFPSEPDAGILIKPNLNSNMNALTGNTTDLRLIAAVVEILKERGYKNITIGEGTNSGFYRSNISVISRLRVDSLAGYYGIATKDLNYSDTVEIDFEDGVTAEVAKECVESELIINMPKLKTHFEAGMSVCMKNLMGCLVGMKNKKKTHLSLAANIVNLNRQVRPHIHIVDALISMEGTGPSRGTPLVTNNIFVGRDPFLIDLICTRFASYNYRDVTPLAEAEAKGLIGSEYLGFAEEVELKDIYKFKKPDAGVIAGFIHNPKRQKYFLAIRNTPFFNYICSTGIAGRILFMTGLRQDVFIDKETEFKGLSLNKEKCTDCGKCLDFCPIDLELPGAFSGNIDCCIQCLYCYCICPENAIELNGELGFMEEQIRQYDKHVRGNIP